MQIYTMLITKLFTDSYFINTPTAFYSSLGIFLPVSDGQQLGELHLPFILLWNLSCVLALKLNAKNAKMNNMWPLPSGTLQSGWGR